MTQPPFETSLRVKPQTIFLHQSFLYCADQQHNVYQPAATKNLYLLDGDGFLRWLLQLSIALIAPSSVTHKNNLQEFCDRLIFLTL